jgi:hypothetical protein
MELIQQYWSVYWLFVLRTLDSVGVPSEYQFLSAVGVTFVLAILALRILSSIFGGSSHGSYHYHNRSGFSDHGRQAMESAHRAHQNAMHAHQNAVRTHQNMMHHRH